MGQAEEHEAEFFALTASVQDERIYEQLESTNLCALVAEKVMGWHPISFRLAGKLENRHTPNTFMLDSDGACYQAINGEYPLRGLFQPDVDIAAAFRVEEKIKERGLHVAYVSALLRRVLFPTHEAESVVIRMPGLFNMVHAGPRDRCLAALEVVGIIAREKAK